MCVLYSHISLPPILCINMGSSLSNSFKTIENSAEQSITKYITHTPQRISAKPLYFSLQMPKFEDIVKLQIAKLMHQCSNKIVPMHYFDLVQVDHTHKYNTRHAFHGNFKQPYVRTELVKKTISFIGQNHGVKFIGTSNSVVFTNLKKNIKSF